MVSINADPYGEVWIDGRYIGDAPVRNLRLPAGTYTVETRYAETRQRATITISPDAPASVTHTYVPQ